MSEAYIKISAALIIILAAVLYGNQKIKTNRQVVTELDAFKHMIEYITANIEYFSKPIPEIMREYNNAYLEGKGLITKINTIGLKTAILSYDFCLSKQDITLIHEFCDRIGNSYIDEELKLCSYTSNRLNARYESLKGEIKNKEKLYRTLPLMLAISVILILI